MRRQEHTILMRRCLLFCGVLLAMSALVAAQAVADSRAAGAEVSAQGSQSDSPPDQARDPVLGRECAVSGPGRVRPGCVTRRFDSAIGVAGARFGDPADVAAGGGFNPLGFAKRPGLSGGNRRGSLRNPCDTPSAACGGSTSAPGPSGGVLTAPTNPWVPGQQPGGN